MILDLGNCRERYLYYLPVRDFHLYAGCGEGLGGLHTPHCPPHPPAVRRDDLHVVLAIKRLECCECFGNFHNMILPVPNYCLCVAGSLSRQPNATGKHYLAYRTCPCILRLESKKVDPLCRRF